MFRQDLEEKVRAMPKHLTEELPQQKTLVDCKTQLKEIFGEALADFPVLRLWQSEKLLWGKFQNGYF